MYRKILIPTQTHLELELPEEFIGHQVELIAFTTDEAEKRKYTLEENEKFYSQFSFDNSQLKFNREDLYDR